MNDSDTTEPKPTPLEVEFVVRCVWEQCEHLGHPQHSPATVWLRTQGVTFEELGDFINALRAVGVRPEFLSEEPNTPFQSPWGNRQEFLDRLQQLGHAKPSSPPESRKNES